MMSGMFLGSAVGTFGFPRIFRGLTAASHQQRRPVVARAPECFASGRQRVRLQHSENSLFVDLTEVVARQQGSDASWADMMWRR